MIDDYQAKSRQNTGGNLQENLQEALKWSVEIIKERDSTIKQLNIARDNDINLLIDLKEQIKLLKTKLYPDSICK